MQRIPPRAKTQEPLKRTGFFKRKLQHYVTLACRAKASHRAQLTGLPKVEGDTSAQVVVGHSLSGTGNSHNSFLWRQLLHVVIHRNHCEASTEGYVIKFSGPHLIDPGRPICSRSGSPRPSPAARSAISSRICAPGYQRGLAS